jgi:transglutaminase-like putative cysteine protease
MRIRFVVLIGVLMVSFANARAFAGDDAPAWLRQAANLTIPTYDKDVTAVVLVDDGTISVSDDGRVVKVYNFAVRILRRDGRGYAQARVGYVPESGKVKELRAWLIRGDGEVKRYGKDETLDLAGTPNDVYDEYRFKRITADSEADAGMVFGYTYTTEDRTVFSQDDWAFQGAIPAVSSRYTLVLPSGWHADSVTFNHSKVEPRVSGTTYSWELSNLDPVPREPLSPSLTNLVARLAVSYYPPAGQNSGLKTFANWSDVSAWMSELEDPQVVLDDPLAGKARELTANARTEYEKIQAIGRYVQNIQYISIQTGLGRGGGYRPHVSTQVFAKSYGDCKDKANLMRAMLKVLGISAFPVSIYAGDPEYVRPEWPSPQQFNHCIIAVKVSDETRGPTIIQHPRLGRLLIFDPTAEETPVGDLPSYLQGSLALIDSKEIDALVKMPVTPPESNLLDRQIEASIGGDGLLVATIREKANGQWAAGYRGEMQRESRPEYVKRIEGWVTAGATAARVTKVETHDDRAAGRFDLDIEFTATGYGQLMRERLLVFKPAIVSRRETLYLTDAKRKHPVVLTSNSYSETVRVKLPSGFAVDEMPDAVKLDTAFGSYATSYEVKDGALVFSRKLVQRATTIPVEQYNSVRSFFERIRAAEQAPVVLIRK